MYIVPCPLYVLAFRKTEVKLKKKGKKFLKSLMNAILFLNMYGGQKRKLEGFLNNTHQNKRKTVESHAKLRTI